MKGLWRKGLSKIKKFSVRTFLLILICVVMPLTGVCIYIRMSMEDFIQNKLSENVIQNIARGERNISDALQSIAALTNAFVYDDELQERIMNPSITEYDNARYFDQIINRLYISNGFDMVQDTKIILFDNYDRVYSNWSMNYENYDFLLEHDWVKSSMEKKGHVVWSMFSPAYIKGEETTYISMAKAFLQDKTEGEVIGTIIISIGQQKFSDILMEYAYEGDMAYVCTEDGMVLLEKDSDQLVSEETLNDVYSQVRGDASGSLKCKVGGKNYLVSFYTIPKPWVFNEQQLKVFHFTDYQEVTNQVMMISSRMNTIIVLVIGVLILILYISIRMLVSPIALLSSQMQNYTLDSEITGIDTERADEIGQLNRSFAQMSENIKGLFKKLESEHEVKERYRYESLRAQINPHFLFNTLTSIRWMALIRGADNIVDAIDALAHMLKYSMSRDNSLVTIGEEVDNIRNYLYIQNCRYGNHCKLEVELEEDILSLKTMKFILQPIVENSIIHGYDKNREEIIVQIYGWIEDDDLNIYVEDDGKGISREMIEAFESAKQSRIKESKLTGIGMKNVDECIRITFGSKYGLTLDSLEKQGTIVKFRLPVLREETISDEENYDC
jgi:two-component system sensor histidine kinase YesM